MIPNGGYRDIIGMRVDGTSYAHAAETVVRWAHARSSRYVCVANVHMVMEGYDDPHFQQLVNEADLVTPDGMPLVWALRLLGIPTATRVYGPDLTLHVCRRAAEDGLSIALYGGTPRSLNDFAAFLHNQFPCIQIACRIAPPFRPLTPDEDARYTRQLQASGAQIVLVGIGCPKQERWIAAHRGRINAVMIGVGAAFDFHAGRVRQAPTWMQRIGMEWLFRVMMEPRRLWRRYAQHNPRFVWLFARQWLRAHRQPHPSFE